MTDAEDAGASTARTRRRFLAAAGTMVTVATAGCQSGESGTGDGTTTAPAETTGADRSLGYPNGTDESGIEDPTALVEATQSALANADYETTSSLVQPDLTVEQSRRSSLDDKRQLMLFETGQVSNRAFVAGGTTYFRSERDGEVSYSVGEMQGSFENRHRRPQLGGAESLGGILEQGAYTPAGTARHNDRPVRQFTLDSASLPDGEQRVADAEGSVLVDADSVVHEAQLLLDVEQNTGTGPLDRTFTVSALGPLDVPEPDWVDTARDRRG